MLCSNILRLVIERRGCLCIVKLEGFWMVLLSLSLIPGLGIRVKAFSIFLNAFLWPGRLSWKHIEIPWLLWGRGRLLDDAAGSWGNVIRSWFLTLEVLGSHSPGIDNIKLLLCVRHCDQCWVRSALTNLPFIPGGNLCICAQEVSAQAQSCVWGSEETRGRVLRKGCH